MATEEKKSPDDQMAGQENTPSVTFVQSTKPDASYTITTTHGTSLDRDKLEKIAWDKDKKPWSSTLQGRGAIRLFSRGVMGCAFFAVGGIYAGKALDKYEFHNYDAGVTKFKWFGKETPLINNIARFIDVTAGKAIEKTVGHFKGAEAGKRAVTFRPTRYFFYENTPKIRNYDPSKPIYAGGRSLGWEMVSVTFDFAMASIGDAIGRKIVGLLDPNVKKSWIRDDGSIDSKKLAKETIKSTWKIFSYDQAEDWAVALPYVYFMKWQRDKLHSGAWGEWAKGSGLGLDRNTFGGDDKIRTIGRDMEVVGNYRTAGALDLQTRFTVYNVGTLMYRKIYHSIHDKLVDWKDRGYTLAPDDHSKQGKGFFGHIWTATKDTTRFIARNTIEATLYMTPATPFFWFPRVAQSSYKGGFIDVGGKGMVGFYGAEHGHQNIVKDTKGWNKKGHLEEGLRIEKANTKPEVYVGFRREGDYSYLNPLNSQHGSTAFNQYKHKTVTTNKSQTTVINPFTNPYDGSLFNRSMNWLGDLNYKTGDAIKPFVRTAGHAFGIKPEDCNNFSRRYSDALFSYTPYFFAKTDTFRRLWENRQMDMSIDRFLHGVATFSGHDIKEGAKEIYHSVIRQPLQDPERMAQVEAARKREQKYGRDDFSPKAPASFAAKLSTYLSPPSQQPVTYSAKYTSTGTTAPAYTATTTTQKPATSFTDRVKPSEMPASFVAQEQQRKAAADQVPPGATIH